jgi:ubiquitin carboxyl-terminal hydrolase 5/13
MDKITQLASQCRIASSYDTVFKSECVFTFHNPYTSPLGIVVNLHTFVGTIDELAFQQPVDSSSNNHDESNGDPYQEGIFLRIVMNRIPKASKQDNQLAEDQEEKVITKLGLGIEGGFHQDPFETETQYSVVVLCKEKGESAVKILQQVEYNPDNNNNNNNDNELPWNVVQSVESILRHSGAAVQQDVKAFELEEEIPVSKYAETLEFVDNGVKISPNPQDWKCEKSGDVENLWLNLSTGFIGGGRRHWDGSGGSNGALDHYLETGEKYPLVVKLGTITRDIDTADCYSYAKDEDGPVRIPNLATLLAKRGIQVSTM